VADQQVGERLPVVLGNEVHQLRLDFPLVRLLGESEPPGKADHVSVDGDPLDDVVAVLEDDVRGLATHAREVREFVHRVGHLAAVLGDDRLAGRDDPARLLVRVGDRPDVLGEFVLASRDVVPGGLVRLEEVRGHLVDALVGALRREDHGHQQFQSGVEIERDGRIGIFLVQPVDDLRGLLGPGGARGSHTRASDAAGMTLSAVGR